VAQTVSGLISSNQTLAERGLINKQLYVIGASTDELLLSDAQDVALASLIASGMTDGWKVEVLQSRVNPLRGSTIWLVTAPSHEEALKLLDPQTAPWLTAGVPKPGAVAGGSSSTRSIGRLTVLPYPGGIQHSGDPSSQWMRAKSTALAGKSTAGGVHALYNFGSGLYSATQHEAALAQQADAAAQLAQEAGDHAPRRQKLRLRNTAGPPTCSRSYGAAWSLTCSKSARAESGQSLRTAACSACTMPPGTAWS